MAKQMLKGRFTMDLPIDLCLDKTSLQMLGNSFRYTPYFQRKIDEAKDSLEEFKWIIAQSIAANIVGMVAKNPLESLDGETWCCQINGNPFYTEQLSKAPIATAYQYLTPIIHNYGSVI